MRIEQQLGGFQEAADLISTLSHQQYSRQGVHQLWKRRDRNGFPERKIITINGYPKRYFDLAEVKEWWEHRNALSELQ
jgi:hypothetical protein